jgi:Family of unknown function (DUF6481)
VRYSGANDRKGSTAAIRPAAHPDRRPGTETASPRNLSNLCAEVLATAQVAEAAARETALEAERQGARDARYAARKTRKRKGK